MLINAMGGIGKTSLASALMEKYKGNFEHLIWLDVKVGVKDAFVNNIALADNLGISAEIQTTYDGTKDTIDKAFALVLNRLRELKKYGLLVLDDADEQLEILTPVLSLADNWKVLVTSRSELEGFDIYKLGFLGLQSAVNLFFYYAGIRRTKLNVKIAEDITSAVWRHTLTIELLAKTISDNNGFNINDLKAALLNNGINAIPEYEIKSTYAQEKSGREMIMTTTNACLKIAFNIYKFSAQPLLEKILIGFSVLPPTPVNSEAIEKMFEITAVNRTDFYNGLKKLVNTSWLIRTEAGYHMHPVIQEVIRVYGEVTPEKTADLISILTKVSKSFDHLVVTDLFLYSIYIKNVLQVFETKESQLVANLAYNYAVFLRNIGRPNDALVYHEIARKYRAQHEPGTAALAEVLCGIAAVKINLGDLGDAEDLLKETILLQKKNLLPDDHNIAITHHNFAVIYKKLALTDPAFSEKAEENAQAAINILTDKPEHEDELATAYVLKGQLQKNRGDYAEAKCSFLSALSLREKIFGEQHQKTVKICEDLALISKLEENWDQAYELMNIAMPVLTDHFAEDSLALGPSHHNYAYILFKKGMIEKAIEEQKKAVKIFEIHLSENSPALIKAKQQLDFFQNDQ